MHFLLSHAYKEALYLFIIAGISDGLDGLLARRFNWITFFGGFLDPLADKLLLISSFLAFAYLNVLPKWYVSLLVTRDLIIVLGASAFYSLFKQIHFQPSLLSKYNTALQVGLVALLLIQLSYQCIPYGLTAVMLYVVISTTLLSLTQYVWVWGYKTYQKWSTR